MYKNIIKYNLLGLLLFVYLSSLVQGSILNETCDYYCGAQSNGDVKILSGLIKNTSNLTLGQFIKKSGNNYKYYFQCCDGKMRTRTQIEVATSEGKIMDTKMDFKVDYPFTYTTQDNVCDAYCVFNPLKNQVVFVESEDLSLRNYMNKYAKTYDYYAYCCGLSDTLKEQAVIAFNPRNEEFIIKVNSLKIDNQSLVNVEAQIEKTKKSFYNTNCDYYCNLNGDTADGNAIVKNTKKISLGEHSKTLSSLFGYTIPCCDKKMKDRNNISIINKKGEVLTHLGFNTENEFSYVELDKTCNYYCGYQPTSKVIYFLNSENLSLAKYIAKYKTTYAYYSYCCDLKSSFTKVMVGANANLEEFDIVVADYKGVSSSKINGGGDSTTPTPGKDQVVVKTTTTKKSKTTSKKSNTTSSKVTKISTSSRCGAQYGRCKSGYCCSQYGYCGNTAEYCGTGCHTDYGVCS